MVSESKHDGLLGPQNPQNKSNKLLFLLLFSYISTDSCRSILLLTGPTCLCISQTRNLFLFIYIYYHNYFLKVFTLHFCKTFQIFKLNLQIFTDCWRSYGQNNYKSLKKTDYLKVVLEIM